MGNTLSGPILFTPVFRASLMLISIVALNACRLGSLNPNGSQNMSREEATHFSPANQAEYDQAYGQMFPPEVKPQGTGKSADIAKMASMMVGHMNCSSWPPGGLKCAVQASTILRASGVEVWDASVNGLVSKLKAQGWKDGACKPGALFHTAGASPHGRHVGVIGQDGRVVHNGGVSDRCGLLGTKNYPSWFRRGRCLVSPT